MEQLENKIRKYICNSRPLKINVIKNMQDFHSKKVKTLTVKITKITERNKQQLSKRRAMKSMNSKA